MAIFLKKWKKPTLRPLEMFPIVAIMESMEEVDLLVKDGIPIIALSTLSFRRWQLWMNYLCESSLEDTRWVAIRGVPIHLLSLGILKAIREVCGGFLQLSCALDDEDVYKSLRILEKREPRIPRVLVVEDW